jgi:hypothetical protein
VAAAGGRRTLPGLIVALCLVLSSRLTAASQASPVGSSAQEAPRSLLEIVPDRWLLVSLAPFAGLLSLGCLFPSRAELLLRVQGAHGVEAGREGG